MPQQAPVTHQEVNIPGLTPVSFLNTSDLITVNQGGEDKSATIAQLRAGAQAANSELTGFAAISGTGLVARTGTNLYSTVSITSLAETILADASASEVRSHIELGTIAVFDAPSSGNATSGQAVIGSDTRLTNSRTPTAHKTSHSVGGSDAIAPTDIGAAATVHTHLLSSVTDAGSAAAKNVPNIGVNATSTQVVMGDDTRLSDSRTPTSHTHTLSQITDAGTGAGMNVPTAGSDANALQLVRGDDTRLGIPAALSVSTAKVQDGAITYPKLQQTTASNVLLGRDGTAAGQVQEISCTTAGRNMIAAADSAAQRAVIGLSNVDNTSDANKPVSSAQATAIGLKQDASTAVTLAGIQTLTNKTLTSPAINSPTGIAKGDVGLGNVDNTSDANKPISTATATALSGKATSAQGALADSAIQNGSSSVSGLSLTKTGSNLVLSGTSGGVVAIKNTVKTDTSLFSSANGVWNDITGLSIAHALSNASNKLLICATVNVGTSGTTNGAGFQILSDSTPIGIGETSAGRVSLTAHTGSLNGDIPTSVTMQFLFTPGDTSSHTYKIQTCLLTGGGGAVGINRTASDSGAGYGSRAISTITITELLP